MKKLESLAAAASWLVGLYAHWMYASW